MLFAIYVWPTICYSLRLTDNIIIKSCTINTFISPLILHCYSFSHEFNKLSLATCVVTIFITPSPWKCIPLPWLYRLYYRLWVSRRIDNWQIVYLSNKDPCPKISIHKSEIKVGLPWSHGQRWKFTSFSIHKVARPSGTNLQLAAVHERPWGHYCTLFSLLWIDIVGLSQGSLYDIYDNKVHTEDNTDGKSHGRRIIFHGRINFTATPALLLALLNTHYTLIP